MVIPGMLALLPVPTSTTPEPSVTPLPGSETVDQWSSYFERTFGSGWGNLAFIGVMIVLGLLLWAAGRWVITLVTRSIEEGLPLTERKARSALKRARISIPLNDTLDARLERERRKQRARTIRIVLNSTLAVLIITTVTLIVLAQIGISIAPLLASAGIVGVALGFGAQSLVKDLIAGVFMLVEDQYGVGDIIDVGEASGVVEEIGLRSVRLRSVDGTMWYVPNGNITRVGNMTRLWSRAMLEIKLGYDTDLDEAREAMLAAVEAARKADEHIDSSILSEPEVPGIESFDYDSVTVRLLIQVQPATQWDVMRALRREIRREFAQRGIAMSLPHQGFKLSQPAPADLRAAASPTHADPAHEPGLDERTRSGSVVRGDEGDVDGEGDE
ncbi:mechanosensitive ion channel family protein [Demequina capsici]|uniref:Mechanosensitive ion channel family protein n=1 Tax=Demequina capsici TaxID=3075620 RepID=A0AA96F9K8_9MICO|nr:mechanosensitive ion channel family protein [Demequina sp. OYTSA14]WNM25307.1 mechanosensitive ion channel family protein [Demequina sp. OYTSA14]